MATALELYLSLEDLDDQGGSVLNPEERDEAAWGLLEAMGLDRTLFPEARFRHDWGNFCLNILEGDRNLFFMQSLLKGDPWRNRLDRPDLVFEVGSPDGSGNLFGGYSFDNEDNLKPVASLEENDRFVFEVPRIGGYRSFRVNLPYLVFLKGREVEVLRANPEALIGYLRVNAGGGLHHFLGYSPSTSRVFTYDPETGSMEGRYSYEPEARRKDLGPPLRPVLGPELFTRDTFEL